VTPYRHAHAGINNDDPPPSTAPIEIPPNIEAQFVAAQALVFGVTDKKRRREALQFMDDVQDACGGDCPTWSKVEWRRRFRAWRTTADKVAQLCRVGDLATPVSRKRVSGRQQRVHRRPAASRCSDTSDDGGGDPERLRAMADEAFRTAHEFHALGWIPDGADFFYARGRRLRLQADAIERVRTAMTEARRAAEARVKAHDGRKLNGAWLVVGGAQ